MTKFVSDKARHTSLETILMERWPKLAWCAHLSNRQVRVLHGPRVEIGNDWIFEGTWSGEFALGDFDRPVAMVAGTGLRIRENQVAFVTSTNKLDRLFFIVVDNQFWISNSVACLLRVAGLELEQAYPFAKRLGELICDQIYSGNTLRTNRGDIQVLTNDRLICDFRPPDSMTRLRREEPHGDMIPEFATFRDYQEFLHTTMEAVRDNLRSNARRFKITPVATVSKGYDSPAAMIVAECLEFQRALTISRVGLLSQHDDSGAAIAQQLDVEVRSVVSSPARYRDYDLVWAGLGSYLDLNMTMFDFTDDLTFLTVGTHGDIVWQKGLKDSFLNRHHYLDRAGDISGCGLTEWRLHKGVFFGCLPCIGASQMSSLARIHASRSMAAWRLGGDYDRPIPRRIIEERGIDRGLFGRQKMASLPGYQMFYPNDRQQMLGLQMFLRQHGKRLPRRLGFLRAPVHVMRYKLGERFPRFRLPRLDDFLFIWANSRLAKHTYVMPKHILKGPAGRRFPNKTVDSN